MEPHEVRITWLHAACATDATLAQSVAWLGEDERARLGRFAREDLRRDFVLGRWLARRALESWSGVPAAAWSFELGPHGRPIPRSPDVPSGREPPVNLAHGGGLVVCASARASGVGVDVEDSRRDVPVRKLERFFAAVEVADLARLDDDARRERFWRLWTLKEAWLKARGTGIAGSLSSFVVRFRDPEPPYVDGPDDAARWVLFEHCPTGTHRLAVAARAAVGGDVAFRVVREAAAGPRPGG